MNDRPFPTPILQALIDEEQERTANAEERLGSFVPLVRSGLGLLSSFIETVDRTHFMAAALMLATQKTATLAFLSYVRGHIAQAEFNVRQTVEFAVLAAYMLAHPEEDVTACDNERSPIHRNPKTVSAKAYKWLDGEQPHLSGLLKDIKGQINDTTAHASLYLTQFTFDWEVSSYDTYEYKGFFFDNEEDDAFRLHLMSLARLLVIVVETIRQVAEVHGGCALSSTANDELHTLDRAVNAHRDSLARKMGIGPYRRNEQDKDAGGVTSA